MISNRACSGTTVLIGAVRVACKAGHCLFGTTPCTFHPHLICQLSPYSERIHEQQDDIVLEGSISECTEDSAMEGGEPETQQVAGMVTAT